MTMCAQDFYDHCVDTILTAILFVIVCPCICCRKRLADRNFNIVYNRTRQNLIGASVFRVMQFKLMNLANAVKQAICGIVDVSKEVIRAALFLACGALLVWYVLMPMLATLDILLTEYGPFELVLLFCSGCTVLGGSVGAAHSLYCKFSAQKNRRRNR